jgi:hypothetical protein
VFLVAGALPVGLVLAYNLGVVGHVAGAYALLYKPNVVHGDVPADVAVLLFSPTHGLFVFSPFLLVLPCCLSLALRDRSTRGLTAAICGAVVLQLIVYGVFKDWRQGVSFGPRWLTDMLPMFFGCFRPLWPLCPLRVASLSALPAASPSRFTTGPDNTNNVLALAFGVLIVTILVAGSLWIMANLNNNMMPSPELMDLHMQH